MKSDSIKKYTVFVLAVAVFVVADQWTKWYSEQRLATQNMSHMQLEVDADNDGKTVQEYLTEELAWSSEEEVADIAARLTTDVHGQGLRPDEQVTEGQTVEVRHREVVLIEDYWDFQYTRNPGAAFGLMAEADEDFRKPFFIIVSLLAVGIILGILRKVPFEQQILFWGLTLIAAGAIGNFIDRAQFGYVIDFVVWKYTDDYRWPTFNVADVLICVGVGLMVIEIIRDGMRDQDEPGEG